MGARCLCSGAESLAVLDTGAAADLVRFRLLGRRNKFPERNRISRVTIYPACARFKFGLGRLGEVRYVADIPAGMACCRDKFGAFVLEADISASLRQGPWRPWAVSRMSPAILRLSGNWGRVLP